MKLKFKISSMGTLSLSLVFGGHMLQAQVSLSLVPSLWSKHTLEIMMGTFWVHFTFLSELLISILLTAAQHLAVAPMLATQFPRNYQPVGWDIFIALQSITSLPTLGPLSSASLSVPQVLTDMYILICRCPPLLPSATTVAAASQTGTILNILFLLLYSKFLTFYVSAVSFTVPLVTYPSF